MKVFSIITLFPEVFDQVLNFSILKRAQEKRLVKFELINLRDFGIGKHKSVDDKPYGGGVGMVLRADVLAAAVQSLKLKTKSSKVLLTAASGEKFNQKKARELVKNDHLIIICGHYEGVDQRFVDKYIDEEISVGDYVLTGGELPAMIIVDAVTRVTKGVLIKEEATLEESFEKGLLEYPHYTRPEVFDGIKVPDVLLSGNHQKIKEYKKELSLLKTASLRPDLVGAGVSDSRKRSY